MQAANSRLRCAIASILILAGASAHGQASPPATGSAAASGDAANKGRLEEITVTGSRVVLTGNDAPTPMTVLSPTEVLATKPTTLFENLADLPMFSGSRGVTAAPTNAQPTAATSISALNLRNLGGLRALALFDGYRVPPTTADGYVNINSLPQMLVQRVDVVTGGASAVYGSDAVTGVVNFVVDRNFTGTRIDLQGGASDQGDAESYQIGIAWGADLFEGRGHLEASWQRFDDDGISHRNDRRWTSPRWTLQGNGTSVPYHLERDVNIITTTFGGMITCAPGTNNFHLQASCATRPLVSYTFEEAGVLSPLEPGLRGPANGLTDGTVQIGGGGAYHTWPSLRSESQTDQVFARFDFDFTDNLGFFVQGSGTRDDTSGFPTNLRFFQPTNVGACNAFLPAETQAALGCSDPGNQAESPTPPVFSMTKMFNYLLNPNAPGAWMQTIADSYFVTAGLEGSFGEGWSWKAAYTNARSELETNIHNNQSLRNTYAAIDAVRNPTTGEIVCRVSLTNPDLYPGCVPIDLFGPASESKEAFDYIFQPVVHTTTHKMDDFSASLVGAPFNTWAGPLRMAVSGEYRVLSYELVSSSYPGQVQDCVGLRFGNCRAGITPVNINVIAPRSEVEQKIAEAALEFNVPLLNDVAFAQALDLNLAARYAEYDNEPDDPVLSDSSFDATTWKVGLVWDVTDSMTFRAATSKDIRAPNLYDLFAPVAVNPNTFTTDYLLAGNPQYNVPQQLGGNPDLQPEEGLTTTFGFVFRPLPGWSMSIDYYDIKIEDALASLNGAAEGVQRACYASGGSSPLCALQDRVNGNLDPSPTNTLIRTYNRQVNIAEQTTWGIDFETNWATEIASRPFNLRFLLNYQPELIYKSAALPTVDHAGAAYNQAYNLLPAPVWKAVLFMRYRITDKFAVDLSERYRSSLEWFTDDAIATQGGVDEVYYTNVSASYDFDVGSATLTAFVNVQNLLDEDPPPSGTIGLQNQPNLPTNGWATGDDVVGRYYILGVRARF